WSSDVCSSDLIGHSRDRSSDETVLSNLLSPYCDPTSHTFCRGELPLELNSSSPRACNISRSSFAHPGRRTRGCPDKGSRTPREVRMLRATDDALGPFRR